MRVLRIIEELRTLVSSLAGAMRSLGWTMILLFVAIYMVALCITQMVSDHLLIPSSKDQPHYQALCVWFCSLGRSILTLFECITGGANWDEVLMPLYDEVSPLSAA